MTGQDITVGSTLIRAMRTKRKDLLTNILENRGDMFLK
jgi:hypothetical protein